MDDFVCRIEIRVTTYGLLK